MLIKDLLIIASSLFISQMVCASVDDIVEIVTSVVEKYRTGCVFLLESEIVHVSDFKNFQLLKRLSDVGVTTSVITSHLAVRCNGNLPLYVVLNQETVSHLFTDETNGHGVNGRWLVFVSTTTTTKEYFSFLNISMNCEFLVVQKPEESDSGIITEVFKVHPSKQLQENRIAIWNAGKNFTWTRYSYHQRRSDFEGLVMQGALSNFGMGHSSVKAICEGKPVKVRWYYGECWRSLEETLNFTTDLQMPHDESAGSLDNGTWNGIMRMMKDGKVEVAVSPVGLSSSRFTVGDFTNPIFSTRIIIRIQEPGTLDNNWALLIQPFSLPLWIVVASSMMTLMVNLTLTSYIGNRYGGGDNSCHSSMFRIFRVFCQQGDEETHRSWACGLVCVTALLTSVIMFIAYSATITSFLTVQRIKLPFTTYQGLLEDSSYQLAVRDKTSPLVYFQTADNPLLKEVYKKLIVPHKKSLPQSFDEGIKRMCKNKKYAFMSPAFIAVRRKCRSVIVPEAFYKALAAFSVKKGSPYLRSFNYILLMMQQSGVLKRIQKSYEYNDDEDQESSFRIISLDAVASFFIILIGGIVLATAFLFFEIVWNTTFTTKVFKER